MNNLVFLHFLYCVGSILGMGIFLISLAIFSWILEKLWAIIDDRKYNESLDQVIFIIKIDEWMCKHKKLFPNDWDSSNIFQILLFLPMMICTIWHFPFLAICMFLITPIVLVLRKGRRLAKKCKNHFNNKEIHIND